ncbi:MAG: CHC2 zinc finger domain-containing protein [Polyangia bacterium]
MTGQATQTPDSENARRCDRRAFSSAAISRGKAKTTLAPDSDTIKSALSDPERVLGLLGLLDGAKRQAHGFMVCCPWHSERTPSCSVKLASDGTIAAHCFGCGAGGDVLSLVAAARGLDARRDFPRVVELAADLAGGSWMATPRPCVEPCQRRDYRPRSKASARCGLLQSQSPMMPTWHGSFSGDVSTLQSSKIATLRAVCPHRERFPSGRGVVPLSWWKSGHRLLFPLWNAEGSLCSMRTRLVESGQTERTKRNVPRFPRVRDYSWRTPSLYS